MDWPVVLPDKSGVTVTLGFCTFVTAVNAHEKPACLCTDNGLECTNKEIRTLTSDNNIRRKYTSVDGPKRNRHVEQKLALVA